MKPQRVASIMTWMAVRVALVVLVLAVRVAVATSYAPPEKRDVRSPDGAFVLHVDPDAARLTVASSADPGTPLWSLPRRVQFEAYFLAPGGQHIAVVAWRFVHVEQLDAPGVEILGPSGAVATYSVRSLVAQPPVIHGVGPIGPFWRNWLAGASQDGARLIVETTGLHRYVFDLVAGRLTASELRPAGLAMLAVAFTFLLVAAALVIWTRRARQAAEWPAERRRFGIATAPPIAALVWLWLHVGGMPFVPAEYVAMVRLALIVVAIGITPFALLAIARLPAGRRLVRLLLAIATPFVVGLVAIFW
jgi:hypothetical protein